MLSRLLTLVVWALVAGCGVYWGAKLMARPLAVPPNAAVATPSTAPAGDLSRLFGAPPPVVEAVAEAAPPPPPEASRFQLIGVVAARRASHAQGVALIAVDGKSPRAFRVGSAVDGDLVLQSVQARGAVIGARGGVARVSLELPPLPAAATGVPTAQAGRPGTLPVTLPGMVPGLPLQPMPAPVAAPPQLAMPGFAPGAVPNLNALPQARLRSLRGAPAGQPMQGMAPAAQDESSPPAEGNPQPDGRNLR